MSFPTDLMRESAAIGSVTTITHIALFSTAGGTTPGTELSGSGYARQSVTWQHGATDGSTTGTVKFTIPAGAKVAGYGFYTAVTGGTYMGGGSLVENEFDTAGEYDLTITVRMNSAGTVTTTTTIAPGSPTAEFLGTWPAASLGSTTTFNVDLGQLTAPCVLVAAVVAEGNNQVILQSATIAGQSATVRGSSGGTRYAWSDAGIADVAYTGTGGNKTVSVGFQVSAPTAARLFLWRLPAGAGLAGGTAFHDYSGGSGTFLPIQTEPGGMLIAAAFVASGSVAWSDGMIDHGVHGKAAAASMNNLPGGQVTVGLGNGSERGLAMTTYFPPGFTTTTTTTLPGTTTTTTTQAGGGTTTTTTTQSGGGGTIQPGNSVLHPTYLNRGSVMQRDVRGSAMPLAHNSAQIAANIRQQQINTGYYTGLSAWQYNFPSYVIRASQTPMATVTWRNLRKWTWTPQDVMDAAFGQKPIPEYAVPAGGTDAALVIYDIESDTMWEYWQMIKTGPYQWAAEWGSTTWGANNNYDNRSDVGSLSASGLNGVLGQMGIGEIQAGWVDHALIFALPAPGVGHSWPAKQNDGWSTDANAPKEGQWGRLNPSFNVEGSGFNELLKILCRAAQRYGICLVDRAGSVSFCGESGAHAQATTGVNPWTSIFANQGGGFPDWEVLRFFPWEHTQWAPVDWGKP